MKDLTIPTYFDSVPHREMLAEYPIGPDFVSRFARMSRDELRQQQNHRFVSVMKRAWEIPFYRRLWSGAGLTPADVRSLDDIERLPTYSKADLMRSVDEHPPFGDFHGMESFGGEPRPVIVFQTTSGTTGKPLPLLYGPKSREMQNLLLARAYLLQGLRASDIVQSVYAHGLVNGGHYVRETFLHFTTALFISAGTGVETRSRAQVELMRHFGVTVLVGFPDYIRHLADVAREMGIVPGRDVKIRMIVGQLGGESRAALGDAWAGAERRADAPERRADAPGVFDWYGVADAGVVAAEGPDHAGLYLWEDAHHVEILDVDSGAAVVDGTPGNVCVTVLFKDDVFPMVRYNTNDVSAIDPSPSPLGLPLRRLTGVVGRSDNMIKLRGINVYPTAIGEMLQGPPGVTGEYLCRVDHIRGRDEMTVLIEVRGDPADRPSLMASYRELFKRRLGVDVLVEIVDPGSLLPLTGAGAQQKPVRLIHNRFER